MAHAETGKVAGTENRMQHVDRSLVLRGIGALSLLAGVAMALVGPIEVYCFYLFSEGGRFHYEGFGFGSFMFGNIAAQVIGYHMLALILIPLGYGHLKLRSWARTLALALLWLWLILGIPLVPLVLLVLLASKDISPAGALAATVVAGASYLVVPALMIRFYRGRNVQSTLAARNPSTTWFERVPLPNLVLSGLFLFYIVVLYILLLFNGIAPAFGTWLTGMQGITAIDASILCLALLTWGTLRSRPWAWWGALAGVGLLAASSIATLVQSSWTDILTHMALPPTELDFLAGMPIHGVHLAVLVGIPLLATMGLIVGSRRHLTSPG